MFTEIKEDYGVMLTERQECQESITPADGGRYGSQMEMIQKGRFFAQEVIELFIAEQDVAASSKEHYRHTLGIFFKWADETGRDFADLRKADIIQYKNDLLTGDASLSGQKLSALTVTSYLTSVKLFFAWVHAQNGTIPDIARDVE